jgi:hypothetical protein
MVPFLLWAAAPGAPAPEAVAPRVAARLGEFLALPLRPEILGHPVCHLVWVPLPVEGWAAPLLDADGDERCFAFEYPVNQPALAPSLCALARSLEADDGHRLASVAPPMSLLHLTPDRAWLLNDGLGAAQLFVHRGAGAWAITNRLVLLESLDVPLRIQPEDWALRLSLPYFPDARTGFAAIEYVPPGTRYRVDRDGLVADRLDAFGRWLAGPAPPLPEALEAVDAGMGDYLAHVARRCPVFPCGLSGGRDSRAVVAAVRASGHPFRLRTKGEPDSPEVAVAQALARAAGLPLQVKPQSEVAPEPRDHADVARSLRLALRWQAGAMIVHKHKTLFARGRRFTEAAVNVMGQYGEVLRARLLRLLGGQPPETAPEAAVYAALVDALLAKAPRFWRADVAAWIREETARLARAVPEGLPTLADRLEAFYLLQDVRRWTTGALRAQFAAPVTPFLTPAALWAVFHSPPAARLGDAFHLHTIARHAPDWAGIPVAPTTGRGDSRYFDNRRFWAAVGWEGLRRLSPDGLDVWAGLCDPRRLEATWLEHPDEAAVLLALPAAFVPGG